MVSMVYFVVLVLAAFGYAVFWGAQFVQMMLLADEDFPGRWDKPLWTIVFLIGWFVAPFVFLAWKSAYVTLRHTPPKSPLHTISGREAG